MELPKEIITEISSHSSELTSICLKIATNQVLEKTIHPAIMAIGEDCVEILEYFVNSELDAELCSRAVDAGSVKCLKFLLDNNFPCENNLILMAALNGDTDCLKLLYKHKQYLDEKIFNAAILSGMLDTVKYLIKHNCPMPVYACESTDDVCILAFLHEHGCEITEKTLEIAVLNNNIFCIDYILGNCDFKKSVWWEAAEQALEYSEFDFI